MVNLYIHIFGKGKDILSFEKNLFRKYNLTK